MLNITLPDGNKLNFEKKITGLEVAEKISKSLSKSALLISIDGKLKDLNTVIDKDLLIFSATSKPEILFSKFIFFPSGNVIFGIN